MISSRDPFAAHRQQMRALFGPFGMDPFAVAVAPQMQPHRAPRRQVTIYVDGLYVFGMFYVFGAHIS